MGENEGLQNDQELKLKLKRKQKKLDKMTYMEYQEKGCPNIIQARFLKEIGKIVHTEKSPKLASLMSAPKERDSYAWKQGLSFCIAYLRRYRMEETIKAIRAEGGIIPKEIGFKKSSDLEKYFKRLMIIPLTLKDKTMQEKVTDFNNDIRKELLKGSKLVEEKKIVVPNTNELFEDGEEEEEDI